MKQTSFLLGILLIVGTYQVRQALSSIAGRDLLETLSLSNCDNFYKRLICAQRKYRTFDGTCNNLCKVTRGAIFRPLRRLETLAEPTDYEPGFEPRRVAANPNRNLTNARQVSVNVFRANNGNINSTPPAFTHLTMTWGQFLDHDITLTEMEEVDCGSNQNEPCPQRPGCIGIDILPGQFPSQLLRFNQSVRCINLRRSARDANGDQHNNIITSYIDASQVYGSNIFLAKRLRAKGGRLDVRPFINSGGEPILPPDPETFCRTVNPQNESCFLAGDVRSNENHALTTVHLLWVREHNRIATALRVLNPTWGDERLFQETRKIVAAEIQHITYNEWLAVLFNKTVREREGLLLEPPGQFFEGYDPSKNPEMINSFSTAALRMGHTLIRNTFVLLNSRFRAQGFSQQFIPVRDFYNPAVFFREGNNPYGGILLGLVGRLAQQVDSIFVTAVREGLIFEGPTFDGTVGDLPAINIQRGRDHGLPGYVKFREACGARPAKFFPDLLDTITQDQINRLKRVYANVEDIDLFAGGISEFPTEGSVLGFTFTCIITQQFKDLRNGDRFWYERNKPTSFTAAQLAQIRKATIARVICDNADGVMFIQRDAFLQRTSRDGSNPSVDCDNLPFVELNAFKEESDASQDGGGEPSASVSA